MADTPETLTLTLSTGGDVVIKLRPDLAPGHVERITGLAAKGFYDGVKFHRVIPGFMAQGGDPTVPTVKVSRSVGVEEWLPINKDIWSLTERLYEDTYHTLWGEDGTPESLFPGKKTTAKTTLTDQGPPRAAEDSPLGDPDKPDADDGTDADTDDEGFPYDEPLTATVYPGGRGDPVTRSAPWATTIDPQWTAWVTASIRRARPAQRTTYQVAAPPRVEVGTRVKEFKLTGKAASVQAEITIEEEIADVPKP